MIDRIRDDTHHEDGLKIIEAADKWELLRGRIGLHGATEADAARFFRATTALARAVRRWRRTG